jgi:site-specific recombinase XerD
LPSHGEANCAKSGRTRTVKSYSSALEHLAPRIGGKHVEEVTGKLIEEIVTARRHEGVTDAAIKRKQVALSSVIDYAIDEGYTAGNPVLPRLKRIKEDRDPILLPRREDVEKVISRRYRDCTPAEDWSPRAAPTSTVVAHGVSPPVPLS